MTLNACYPTVRPEPVEGSAKQITHLPPPRSMSARGQSLFAVAQKVTKNASPCTPLHPAVLATGGMRRTAHESFANATHSVCRRRLYDRPLLRSSARAEGAVELMFDRFAMELHEPGRGHPGSSANV
jgi:hypothetical protein